MNASELIGLPVMSIREGASQGVVRDLIVDPERKIVSFIVVARESKYDLLLMASSDVMGVGGNYLIVAEGSRIRRVFGDPKRMETLSRGYYLDESQVITDRGEALGPVSDYSFDTNTWTLTNVQIGENTSYAADRIMGLSGRTVFVRTSSAPLPQPAPQSPSSEKAKAPVVTTPTFPAFQAPAEKEVPAAAEKKATPVRNRAQKAYASAETPASSAPAAAASAQKPASSSTKRDVGAAVRSNLRNLLVGKRLARDVTSRDGIFSVSEGTVLTEWHLQLAEQHDAAGDLLKHVEPA